MALEKVSSTADHFPEATISVILSAEVQCSQWPLTEILFLKGLDKVVLEALC
jgi:hypothetical protein